MAKKILKPCAFALVALTACTTANAGGPCLEPDRPTNAEDWLSRSQSVAVVEIQEGQLTAPDSRVGTQDYLERTLLYPLPLSKYQFSIIEKVKGDIESNGTLVGIDARYLGTEYESRLRNSGYFGSKISEQIDKQECAYVPVILDVPGKYVIAEQSPETPLKVLRVTSESNWQAELDAALAQE